MLVVEVSSYKSANGSPATLYCSWVSQHKRLVSYSLHGCVPTYRVSRHSRSSSSRRRSRNELVLGGGMQAGGVMWRQKQKSAEDRKDRYMRELPMPNINSKRRKRAYPSPSGVELVLSAHFLLSGAGSSIINKTKHALSNHPPRFSSGHFSVQRGVMISRSTCPSSGPNRIMCSMWKKSNRLVV
ncbi:hypothetical protein EJ03DRAFT_22028 [Teratosphaeria nubilosa]|uniref:Uncharacterized protein n=1 Tax=Teratosphaeria nubilosa TaxID=161662 RepID=A0A6G1LFG8_9PEZI|nr:hypothetical protein EJ03DRAFT_22028 [Teratosphaeria nubilosa]